MLAERARSLSHAVAGELCRLKQQFLGGALNLAVEAAHNACKRRGLVAVAYYKVFMVELEGLFVEGDNLFAFFSAADDYLPALEGGEVERVHRLAHFKEHKVCYVDNIIYRAQSAQRQPPSHPHGRRGNSDILYVVRNVSGAQVGRKVCNLYGLSAVHSGVGAVGALQRLAEHGRHFAGYAQNALAVGSVGCYANIKDVVVEPQKGFYVLAVLPVGGQQEEAVVVGTLEHISAHAYLHARTEHTV